MRKGFWNGILTGSIMGALIGLFVAPQLKPDTRRSLKKQGNEIQSRARKVMKGVRNSVKGLIK